VILEPSNEFVRFRGVLCRVYSGATETGTPIHFFLAGYQVLPCFAADFRRWSEHAGLSPASGPVIDIDEHTTTPGGHVVGAADARPAHLFTRRNFRA